MRAIPMSSGPETSLAMPLPVGHLPISKSLSTMGLLTVCLDVIEDAKYKRREALLDLAKKLQKAK
jgi:hypothetical protein